ncbi:hypothetical protein AVEN_180746-1 [Araneus ventricosus]|uniref:Reverse transcriptase zinc-binding domain-containing protein n=1 Tax=Araneus ventricosus TaxID=182803 RepID=A0A4Y2Q4K4_ARAVE|nr:hypothetical protein AVEN_180746-1 [Araneus ventricosus]
MALSLNQGIELEVLLPALTKKFLITNKFLIYFLTNHGPFPCYLHRFQKLGSPLCACGLVGDADHYVFRCPLTTEFHLKEPSDEHRKSWFKNLRHNGQAQSKLIQAYKISNGICDRLTQGLIVYQFVVFVRFLVLVFTSEKGF